MNGINNLWKQIKKKNVVKKEKKRIMSKVWKATTKETLSFPFFLFIKQKDTHIYDQWKHDFKNK